MSYDDALFDLMDKLKELREALNREFIDDKKKDILKEIEKVERKRVNLRRSLITVIKSNNI